jgi:hypothetical protein
VWLALSIYDPVRADVDKHQVFHQAAGFLLVKLIAQVLPKTLWIKSLHLLQADETHTRTTTKLSDQNPPAPVGHRFSNRSTSSIALGVRRPMQLAFASSNQIELPVSPQDSTDQCQASNAPQLR